MFSAFLGYVIGDRGDISFAYFSSSTTIFTIFNNKLGSPVINEQWSVV